MTDQELIAKIYSELNESRQVVSTQIIVTKDLLTSYLQYAKQHKSNNDLLVAGELAGELLRITKDFNEASLIIPKEEVSINLNRQQEYLNYAATCTETIMELQGLLEHPEIVKFTV